jgi:hypothetical protein
LTEVGIDGPDSGGGTTSSVGATVGVGEGCAAFLTAAST